MSFQLSPEVDKNKIFLVQCSELKGRFDTHFYKPFFRDNAQRIENTTNDYLGNLVRFSGESWNQKSIFSLTFPYIEIGEINLLTGKINQVSNINIEKAPSRAKMIVRSGDILVSTTRPGRGAISHLENDGLHIASTGFSVVRELRTTNISKRFLFYWLHQSFSLWQMEQRSSGGNYPAITQEELTKIKIPVPPKEIQNEIVAKMDVAYANKKRKEAEAQRLLDSIDDYLLGELGIELPKQTENSLQNRIFTRPLSEVSGGRFIPEYYQEKYATFDKALSNAKYPQLTVGDVLTSIVSGSTPKAGGSDYEDNGEYHFIRLINFDDLMGVHLSKSLFIRRSVHENHLKRSSLIKGDVLFGIAGSIGKIAIYNHTSKANINQAIARLRFKDNTNYIYMAYLLNSIILKHQIERNKRPVAQPNLNTGELGALKIPVPPLTKQTEIANHISGIRNQAKQLQQQAKVGLTQAKKEVEIMILGENEGKM